MRSVSRIVALAALAAVGLVLAPAEGLTRGAGAAGNAGRSGAGFAVRGAGHFGSSRGVLHHGGEGRLRYPFHHRFAGWGWGWGVPWISTGVPVAGPFVGPEAADELQAPLIDFYNTGIYAGGPYAAPLGSANYLPASSAGLGPYRAPGPARTGCSTQDQSVPSRDGGTSQVTIVRC